ncbi:MAG: glutamine--fructose-6-phosphate transaminase (isomerizing), partial [Proteobacteria bacterium]
MCGIVGYIGPRDALSVIISGLEKLEYRGYDSAGVALIKDGKVIVRRAVGKLSELKKVLADSKEDLASHTGLGHTRWATHGRPSETNAHPHTAGRVSLIHNGIIENYAELREELERSGCRFISETDTEIAAHLLNQYLEKGNQPLQALRLACAELRGSFAFVALDSKNPDCILVAKNATPIIIGIGEGETFVASDVPAVLDSTRKVIVLEDGDIAAVSTEKIIIENQGQQVTREVSHITWDPVTAQKGGHKHFMLKEILEQTQVVADAFRGRVEPEKHSINLSEIQFSQSEIDAIDRITILACGTAWHAGLIAKFYIESLAGIPCEVDYASEFRYRSALFSKNTLVLAISQSGETADTLAAVDLVQRADTARRPMTMAICNVLGSSLTRKVKNVLYTQAGPEISVASTKAFTSQLVTSLLLAVYLGNRRGSLAAALSQEIVDALMHLPKAIGDALASEDQVNSLAKDFYTARDFLYLGRGKCYPIALEGALKLKEISYIHAEGYPAGEMK